MPERPGKLPRLIAEVNEKLPMTFKMLSGHSIPPVGRDEAVFYENFSANPDGKGQLYFRRHGRIYVIDATTAFVQSQPPGNGPAFRLIDDDWLCWSPTLVTPIPDQRSAGIRWHVSSVTPDRYEFDVGNGNANENTRMYMQKFITGNDASFNNSPFEFVLADSTSFTVDPSTSTYRGLSASGTTTIGIGGSSGSSVSNQVLNPGFETWTTSTQATNWQTPNSPVTNPNRTSSPVHSGSFSCALSPVDTVQGGDIRSSGAGSPFNHYITMASNSQACRLKFWVYGNGSAVDKKLYWTILVYTGNTDTAAAYSLRQSGGVLNGWGASDPFLSVCPFTTLPQDAIWHQQSYDFTFNPGTPAATYYVVVQFFHAGTTNSGSNSIYIDDIEFGPTTGSTITAPLTVRGLTLDQWKVKPLTLASGDTLSMTAVAGAWLVPTLKPTLSDASAVVTLTTAYGGYSGITLDNSGNSGTFTVTTGYSHYFEDPGVGTTKYGIFSAGNIGLASNKLLKIFGTSTGFTSIVGGAQGGTNIAWVLPTAQGAANSVLRNDGSGALSWVLGSAVAYTIVQEEGVDLPQEPKLNFISQNLTAADDAGNTRTNVTLTDTPTFTNTTLTAFLDLTSTSTPAAPSVNNGHIFTRVNGGFLDLIYQSTDGSECILCSLPNSAHVNTLVFNGIEP